MTEGGILTIQEQEAQISCAIAKADNRGQDSTDRQLFASNSERELPQVSSVISEDVKSQSTGETLLTKPSENDSRSSSPLPHVYSSLSLHWKPASQLSLILVLTLAVILVVSQVPTHQTNVVTCYASIPFPQHQISWNILRVALI